MCRKNLSRLTPQERQAFTNAVLQLDLNGGYDVFAEIHSGAGDHGHFGPSFFAWHRRFCRDFELALQQIDSNVWLPYWDFTVANLNTAGTESLIWRADFMGGPGDPANGFRISTGPFAPWNLRRNAFDIFSQPGNGGIVTTAMGKSDFDQFHPDIEGSPHGRAHTWTGGDVADFRFSPRDPVFFLIHCNIDRLWAEWIDRWEGTPGFAPHEPVTGAAQGHNLNDTMWPWNGTTNPFGMLPWTATPVSVRPADLLDHTAVGYRYDTIDSCGVKPLKERLPKEILKERLKERLKEIMPPEGKRLKERLKERLPKEIPEKSLLKERGPKELKDIRENPKDLVEDIFDPRDTFIPEALRPDLNRAALNFEPDLEVDRLSTELEVRSLGARRRPRG